MKSTWRFIALIFIAEFVATTIGGAQVELVDSLRKIPGEARDTAWVDMSIKASFGAVYTDPSLTEEFLREIYGTADGKGFDSRKSRILLNQGIAKDVMNQPDSALWFYKKALTIAKVGKDTARMASAYNNIGLIYWNSERLDSALINYRLSEDLFKSVNNQRGLLSTMNNIGLIYQSMEREDECISYFRKVVAIARETDNLYFLAVGHQNLATAFSYEAIDDSAYTHLNIAIPIQKETEDFWGLSKSYHTMSTVLTDMDSLKQAESILFEAIEINKTLDNKHALASNYHQLATVYKNEGNKAKQLGVLKKAYELRKDYDDRELYNKTVGAYNILLVDDWNSPIADELYEVFVGKDEMYREKLEGKVLALQEEYEKEKREQELRIKDLEIADQAQAALQRDRLIGGLIILLFMFILFGVLFVRYRTKISRLRTQQRLAMERSRISRDLHDNIGAHLTAMSTRIDLLDGGNTNRNSELEKIQIEASDTVSMLRDTIWAMHREEFTMPQFMSRIRQYANRVLPQTIKIDLDFDSDLAKNHLNSSEALNLFRIAQEAIQNCMKHSEASSLRIQLSRNMGKYEFLISDNGQGCTLKAELKEDSYGLQNIRERSAEIKGQAFFESENGKGFTVRVSF